MLGTSLHEAFDQVQKCTPASPRPKGDSPFRSFKLDTNSKESDVCVLGNVKASYEPPKDIPDAQYGDALKRFREHIHKRVTSTKNEVDVWKGRSILEFSEYLEEVWKCIGSANFSLTFTNIREHATFDLLDSAYKKIERRLNDAYYKAFQYVEREMLTQKKALVASANKADHGDQRLFGELKTTLENRIKEDIEKLNKETRDTVNQKGREKWSRQYENQWNLFKIKQAQDWEEKLEFKFANMFTYEKQLENYKIEMRQSIRDFFKNKGARASSVTKAEQRKEFEEIYETFLARAKKNFPPKDIEKEIANVYINSSIIKGCQIDIVSIKTNSETVIRCRKLKNKLQSNNFHDSKESKSLFKPSSIKTQNVLPPFKTQFNVNDRTTIKDNEDQCARSVYKHVVRLVADKRCYDNSIVQDVIEGTKTHIISHSLSVNSSFQFAHTFARFLATDLLSEIQSKWEKQNSPFEKFNSETNKKAMYEYFILVSKGCQTTRLFAAMMANTLNEVLFKAFEKKMIQITVNAIRNERWMHDARIMHKHIDLHLISLLEDNELDKVLNYLHKPAGIYDIVLKELIKPHIPVAAEIWQDFVKVLNVCIDNAFMLTANPSKMGNFMVARKLADELSKQFLDCKSMGDEATMALGSAFTIDCNEYKDCDAEIKKEFQKLCKEKLTDVLNQTKVTESQNEFATRLSREVIEHMKFVNDAAALPRCDVACPMCGSLCVEPINHDTQVRKHNAVHQPSGIVGFHDAKSKRLCSYSCSVCFEKDYSFYPKRDSNESHKYREFSTYYTEWKDPRINEELAFRQYLLANYNKDIAKKYGLQPCTITFLLIFFNKTYSKYESN